ncbi:MAG: deoxyribose-phosphate aldolase [Alphaproteobacteria bacterium]|jgi:deoxyribose-phosphate aldolase|nr:deoxyribose-phosphate aldolase [Alphaproteobacteria bacterium]MBP9877117.1 deoxyribose-phosphate aldolase [Alphaproteobacteria bacterium]
MLERATIDLDLIQSCLDYTDLSDPPQHETFVSLCEKAKSIKPFVAAVCVWPEFVAEAASRLAETSIEIATVVNFPSGKMTNEEIRDQIAFCLNEGATEIDIVIPYQVILSGANLDLKTWIVNIKSQLPNSIPLKVILESGAFDNLDLLKRVSLDVIQGGGDMLKTSTGKIAKGASLEAVRVMAEAIAESGANVGLKISGGVREVDQALSYVQLVQSILGADYIQPKLFRIGASQLLEKIIASKR